MEAPRNIYITYTASPTAAGGASLLDTIELENSTGKPVTFYLTRQKRYSGDTLNSSYNSMVDIYSFTDYSKTSFTDVTDNNDDDIKLVYNLRHDLSKDYLENLRYVDNTGHTVTGSEKKKLDMKRGWIRGDAALDNNTYYDYSRCRLMYNGENTSTWSEDQYQKVISDGLSFEETPVYYEVAIRIEDEHAKEVASYTGGLAGGTQ